MSQDNESRERIINRVVDLAMNVILVLAVVGLPIGLGFVLHDIGVMPTWAIILTCVVVPFIAIGFAFMCQTLSTCLLDLFTQKGNSHD